jgi:hypothetical protein
VSDTDTTRRRRRLVLLAVGAAALVTLVITGTGIVRYCTGPVDMHGDHVQADDAVPPSSKSSAVPALGDDRFVVQSVGLDVPLGALNVIEPPGFTSAYWVRNEGVQPADGKEGTVFVVMHSLRNGATGPGNFLIDVDRRTSKVGIGAKIQVDDTTYTVTGTQEIDKPDVAHASSIWADKPGRLVVITCLQRPEGGPSRQNVVIEAVRS